MLRYAQDTTTKQLPPDYLAKISSRIDKLSNKLDKKSEKALSALEKSEEKIYSKLLKRRDSTKAKDFLAASNQKYAALKQKLNSAGAQSYIFYLDTLKTSLKFLQDNKGLLSGTKNLEQQMGGALSKVNQLEQSLGNAEKIKDFLKERRQYLKDNLANLSFTKELKKINKQAYYYAEQFNQYKDLVKDKKQLEKKAMELLAKNKAFQDFMKKNSVLGSLFRMPGSDDGIGTASLQGLQTRAQVNSLIQGRIAAGGPGAAAQVQANMQAAQAQLAELKDKVAKLGGGSSDKELPNFKPNGQKTKPFFKRLELGTNIQSQKARFSYPITSDLGLCVAYLIDDKNSIGVGGSYKLGLGTGWENIELTHQGVGIRSFIEHQLLKKGNLFLSGGYEQNYRSRINSFEQLRGYSGWNSSGLIGVSKRYKVSKKLKGNMQLLWDFLSYQQIPKTQALLFRVGYNLK